MNDSVELLTQAEELVQQLRGAITTTQPTPREFVAEWGLTIEHIRSFRLIDGAFMALDQGDTPVDDSVDWTALTVDTRSLERQMWHSVVVDATGRTGRDHWGTLADDLRALRELLSAAERELEPSVDTQNRPLVDS